jgi:oxygen-independent coproporphyrinogen-3 oxidase
LIKKEHIGIYIHVPFCERICSYCDYFVIGGKNNTEEYLDSLIKEIDLYISIYPDIITDSVITSIYIGGGTPSLLTDRKMGGLLSHLQHNFTLHERCEITTESNPSSIDKVKLSSYKASGITRLSIGVQTFNKRELGVLKRNHSPKGAIRSLEEAASVGFESLNLDIMFSIPGQSLETLSDTLDTAIALGTDHFSAYSLIYEPGTPLYEKWKAGKIQRLSDDKDAEFYAFVQNKLDSSRFKQYEVSNFGREGKECRHNLHAWHAGRYLAFGVSSHGYIGDRRYSNHRDLIKWHSDVRQGKLPVESYENISEQINKEENIFLPIRANGISENTFEKNTGSILPEPTKDRLSSWVDKRMVQKIEMISPDTVYRLTDKGYRYCDTITFDLIESLYIDK